jgi:tetratricopeptide (TPR) repeat protein
MDPTPESRGFTTSAESLEMKRLYDPKHFHWLGVLFSGLVPIALASANWGQVGERRKRWLWLLLGLAGYTAVFIAVRLRPTPSAFLAIGVNAGLAYYLRDRQRPLFQEALAAGAEQRPWWQGIPVGIGLLVLAVFLSNFGVLYDQERRVEHALRLVDEHRFAEAAVVLEGVLREDPEDGTVVFDLACTHLFRAQWDEAAQGLERSLVLSAADSAGTYAMLAIAHAGQGRRAEAESLATFARRRDPTAFTKNFGSDDVTAIAAAIARGRAP